MASQSHMKMLSGESAELLIYGVVGDPEDGVAAKQVAEWLGGEAKDAERINVRINSPGGGARDGVAIHNLLTQHPAAIEVDVDGYAASSASLIAMAGDVRRMHPAALMMMHDPRLDLRGTFLQQELVELINYLETAKQSYVEIYAGRSGDSAKDVLDMMAATTWFDGEEAVAAGYATEVVQRPLMAACFDIAALGSIPDDKRARFESHVVKSAETAQGNEANSLPKSTTRVEQKLRLTRRRTAHRFK
ncbi:MAG: head maturation protease, ClpP-related [Planctomycetota bacterium]